MVSGIFKNLLNSGHFQEAGAKLVFGNCGVISANLVGKGYMEMTGVALETSQDIAEEIIFKGGRYPEAQVSVKRGPRVNPDFNLFFFCHDRTRGHADILAGCDCCSKIARPASKPSRATFYLGDHLACKEILECLEDKVPKRLELLRPYEVPEPFRRTIHFCPKNSSFLLPELELIKSGSLRCRESDGTMASDPKQHLPVIQYDFLDEINHGISLLERLIDCGY
ncbi:3-hydroxyisobutyrate dehydrogenase [Culex quinquefasciatus]|uniref:3-hydroxyisobutyrate dehydrogenase n=1 Tax=Culex quinquefasciatus TaxID=7176 RepID=B0XCQ4_CULQU|nr:3-hydroxyisobutyrate dehydrogenase [Culex quinquefasciatus]|eukprot:XP_001867426.1 3-hydroxyisobutyrate dehydrogenase [Culex quinquefasciatus]